MVGPAVVRTGIGGMGSDLQGSGGVGTAVVGGRGGHMRRGVGCRRGGGRLSRMGSGVGLRVHWRFSRLLRGGLCDTLGGVSLAAFRTARGISNWDEFDRHRS